MTVHCTDFSEFAIPSQEQHAHGLLPRTSEEWLAMETRGIAVMRICPTRSFSAK